MKKPRLPKIKISIPFLCLIALMYMLDFRSAFLPTLFAVLIHELSHIAAIKLCGGTVDEIDIRAFGIRANVPELRFMSYKKEIIIAAAGPCAGILTAMGAAATADMFNINSLDYFIGVNIVITAINLIPVYPLDGGRIVLSLALMLLPMRCAYVISYILAIFSIAALLALCALLAIRQALNPSLVIFALYIAVLGTKFRSLL